MVETSADNSAACDGPNFCIRCKNKVGTGIRCIKCGTLSHKSCLNKLKTVVIIDNYTCICCENTDKVGNMLNRSTSESDINDKHIVENINADVEIFKVKLKHLENILKEKDDIIKYQDIAIKSLNDQIDLMKKVNHMFNAQEHIQQILPKQQSKFTNGPPRQPMLKTPNVTCQPNKKPIQVQEVNAALESITTKQLCDNFINIQNDTLQRTTKPKNILIGNGSSTNKCPFKAAPKNVMRHYHVTNMEVDVDVKELERYLKNYAPDVTMGKDNNPETASKCKRCSQGAKVGLRCVTCGNISHESCLKKLKNIIYLDNQTINCCSDISENNSANNNGTNGLNGLPSSSNLNEILELKLKHSEDMLTQKDLTIQNQQIAIRSLQAQIDFMNKEITQLKKINSNQDTSKTLVSSVPHISSDFPKDQNANIKRNNTFSSATVSGALHQAAATGICLDIINLNKDQPVSTNSRFLNKPKNVLIGTMHGTNPNLMAARQEIMKFFHSTNWSPSANADTVKTHLRVIDNRIEVFKLNSRAPEKYTSYKISVPASVVPKILNPEVWPEGVYLNEFFHANIALSDVTDICEGFLLRVAVLNKGALLLTTVKVPSPESVGLTAKTAQDCEPLVLPAWSTFPFRFILDIMDNLIFFFLYPGFNII
ncbi:unnamed protein product [Psylliodes chrysocephalus]|uniref:Phorbol-ester/DAG-type domain-containing protein n=1 Tax=Psylliodes chrysocephalus TaxID=3402493 RepID=A0A9P0GH64_9CUCU|nr:unnamed protein product [Psylliodes chrysocephala]